MHTVKQIYLRDGTPRFHVQFVEAATEPGYRPQRDVIATFKKAQDAFSFCSFLNGGHTPDMSGNGWAVILEMDKTLPKEETED